MLRFIFQTVQKFGETAGDAIRCLKAGKNYRHK